MINFDHSVLTFTASVRRKVLSKICKITDVGVRLISLTLERVIVALHLTMYFCFASEMTACTFVNEVC